MHGNKKHENIKIAPSLICMDFLEIGKQISALNKLADAYHCDISDNHFVPHLVFHWNI
ncbi:MAG: hypothetical protein IPG09_18210 [Ignavibacteria bacterium]|nr:hypothetical protein [Ignavibacteria bacterium]